MLSTMKSELYSTVKKGKSHMPFQHQLCHSKSAMKCQFLPDNGGKYPENLAAFSCQWVTCQANFKEILKCITGQFPQVTVLQTSRSLCTISWSINELSIFTMKIADTWLVGTAPQANLESNLPIAETFPQRNNRINRTCN